MKHVWVVEYKVSRRWHFCSAESTIAAAALVCANLERGIVGCKGTRYRKYVRA